MKNQKSFWSLALPLALLSATSCDAGRCPADTETELPTITVYDSRSVMRVPGNTHGRPKVYRLFVENTAGERIDLGTIDDMDKFFANVPILLETARSPEMFAAARRFQEEGLSGMELITRLGGD